jgi:hypothetical protein
MKMMLTHANKQRQEMTRAKSTPPSDIDRITHDIVNQLSIISLCCCELRNSIAEKLGSDQLTEFGRIEIAVQHAADMIQQLKASWQDHQPTVDAAKSVSAVNRIVTEERYPVLSRSLIRR